MKKILLIAFLIIGLYACKTPYKSYQVENLPKNNTQTPIYYSIPLNTEVVFEVTYLKTIKQKGVFANKSNLLGIKNVIMQDEIKYSVKEIRISSKPKSNPVQEYALFVNADDIIVKKSDIGTLQSIIKRDDNKKFGYVNKDEKKLYPPIQSSISNNSNPQTAVSIPTKPIFETRLQENGMLERVNISAEEAVKRIEQLREKQIDILSGGLEGTYINTTVDYMYKQLDEMIDGYVELFTGSEKTIEETYTYTLTPQKPIIAEEDLTLPLTNSPIPLLARFHTNNQTKYLKTGANYSNDTIIIRDKEGIGGVKGIYYSIPERVLVSVETTQKTFSKIVELNQYGIIKSFNKRNNIIFNPNNASIESIE